MRTWLGLGVPGGYNLEYSAQNYPKNTYDISRLELGSFLEFKHSETARTRLRIGLQKLEIGNLSSSAGPYMLAEENGGLTRAFAGVEYEHMKGFSLGNLEDTKVRFSLSQMVYANLENGGTSKTEVSAAVRAKTQGERFTFGASMSGGHVAALGSGRTSIADRFQLGGESLRGFSERSIGPKENGYVLGGNSFAVVRVEGDMRLASFSNVEVRGGLFAEAGSVWGLTQAPTSIDTGANIRSSVGVSLAVEVGDVPINLFYAVPVDKEAGDDIQRFGFSLSRRF